ncbi:MAG: LOG family protein [Acidobacteria bacterium]|nr:LOG family protein [Acidobacteriota bacterium]
MKVKVGVMGSAGEASPEEAGKGLRAKAEALGRAMAARGCVTLTGATTGLPHAAGAAAHAAGGLHVGISPASDAREHVERFGLPLESTDVLVYTGFGLKGRNVVLVRTCDVVIIFRGGTGTLNELTIAHDEGRVTGCLTGTGGVADEAERLLNALPKKTDAVVIYDEAPERLLERCLKALNESRGEEV